MFKSRIMFVVKFRKELATINNISLQLSCFKIFYFASKLTGFLYLFIIVNLTSYTSVNRLKMGFS